MKKYILKSVYGLVIAMVFYTFSGCSDDSDRDSFNIVCTKWGASKLEVADYMKDYEIISTENGFVCYVGKDNIQIISYQFQNDSLYASLALTSQEKTSLSELQSSFSRYEHWGEKNGLEIYINESENNIVTISEKVKNNNTYFAIGYTLLNAEMLD